MADIKVSVIVPVYNAEKHLVQCLDSICAQTLKEIEIICVDDGSTDSSPAILEEFREKDQRVRVLHQQNLYAGVARNTGKAHANGEYLVFWDSDDFFAPAALAKMYTRITADQADICVCGAHQYFEDIDILDNTSMFLRMKLVPRTVPFNRETNPDYILNFTGVSTMNKMFRRAFVEEHELCFQSVRNGNDVYFVALALCLADKITVVDERLVTYRKNQSSSLVGSIVKSPLSTFRAWIDVKEYLEQRGVFPERSFVNRVTGSMYVLLCHISGSYPAFSETIRFMKEEGLQNLGIIDREEDYYYRKENKPFVSSLIHGSTEEIMSFLLHENYVRLSLANATKSNLYSVIKGKKQEIKELKKKNRKLHKQYSDIRNLPSVRMGLFLKEQVRKVKKKFQ